MAGLNERGVDTSKLVISANAHLITPYHVTLDKVTERFLGKAKIGTTGRGIGPDVQRQDRAASASACRTSSTRRSCGRRSRARWRARTRCSSRSSTAARSTSTRSPSSCSQYADVLRPYVADTALLLNNALDDDKVVLLEGGQGTLLDVDHGTYPFVTSSNPTAGGASHRQRASARPGSRASCGILKAYTTRVGLGPVPDGAARRRRRAAAHDRRRARRHDRPAASLRLVRRADRPLRDARQRPDRHLPDEARRAHRLGADPGVRGVRRRRRARSTRSR